ncbi:MAG: 30S ribosomal protein S1 [Nitrospirae bacterium]|nr:30S ribosomal protein S1 [Nitrospirota bacterium]
METQEKELQELLTETIPEIEEGSIVKGKVVSIRPDSIVVDIGYKSEGFIPVMEFTEEELSQLKEGDEIDVFLSRIDSEGQVSLSIDKAKRLKLLNLLQEAQQHNTPVEAIVKEHIKGGYRVEIQGVKAFMPGSQTDIKPLKNPDEIVGDRILVKVLKFNTKLTNIIVSRREVIEEERAKLKERTLQLLKEGALLKGVVKNITDYGVFVDLGGIDGLLHISDISWGRVRHPSDVFSIGQEVEVIVLNFDKETEKVTLGYKQKRPDPWLSIEDRYSPGKIVSGKVVSLTDYGAFIELEEGVEGLIHVSEMDWSRRPKHPSNYMEIGDYIDAKILNIDTQNKRISLGLKQLKPKPWEVVAQRYRVGQKVTGRVRSITDFGAFVELPEGVDALLHVSDLSWTRHIRHPSEVLRKGQKIEAVVLHLEPEKEKMALGLKQLQPDPWIEEIPSRFHLGDEVKCKIIRFSEYGMFVEIENFVEGLIYTSEINTGNKRPEEIYKEGDEVIARIIKIDLENRKIGLSMLNLKTIEHIEQP